jgi:hypothetical protein
LDAAGVPGGALMKAASEARGGVAVQTKVLIMKAGDGLAEAKRAKVFREAGAKANSVKLRKNWRHHHDEDYHHWRNEQLRKFDQDYDEWRNERRQKFTEDFNKWRLSRSERTEGSRTTSQADLKNK